MLVSPAVVDWLWVLNAAQSTGQPPAVGEHLPSPMRVAAALPQTQFPPGFKEQQRPCFFSVLQRIFSFKCGRLAETLSLLLLALSQKPAQSGSSLREQQQKEEFGAGLQLRSGRPEFILVCAEAIGSVQSSPTERGLFAFVKETSVEEEAGLEVVQHDQSLYDDSAVETRALSAFARRLSTSAKSPQKALYLNSLTYSSIKNDAQTVLSAVLAPPSAPAIATTRRRLAEAGSIEAATAAAQTLTNRKTGATNRALAADGGGVRSSEDWNAAAVQAYKGAPAEWRLDKMGPKAAALASGRESLKSGRLSRGNERKTERVWNTSSASFRVPSHAEPGRDSRAREMKFSKLPQPLPESRVLPALRNFEDVHGKLTLFFNGFSREGSVIAYDLLNELRTVSEAQMMMDVEFLVLDRMIEHYGTPTHLRVVDTTVVHKFLDLRNLLPWKLPELVSNIRKLALEYQPVLRQFLERYEPIIEALVLVNVPAGLKPLRPLLARLFGVPKEKLILASDLEDLCDYIPLKHIPREFGNPRGSGVRNGLENRVSWKIMLAEIKEKLGEDAISPAGKALLDEFKRGESRKGAAAARRKSAAATNTRMPVASSRSEDWETLDRVSEKVIARESDSEGVTDDVTRGAEGIEGGEEETEDGESTESDRNNVQHRGVSKIGDREDDEKGERSALASSGEFSVNVFDFID